MGAPQLGAALASSVVKRGTGPEIALTQALEAEAGVVQGGEVAGVGLMGLHQGAMEAHRGMEGAARGALVLHLEPVISVDSQDTGQTAAQIDHYTTRPSHCCWVFNLEQLLVRGTATESLKLTHEVVVQRLFDNASSAQGNSPDYSLVK